MKWVVSNTVVLNGGDAAILHGVRACLRRVDADAEIVVYDSHPEEAARRHPSFAFRRLAHDAAGDRRRRDRLLAAAHLSRAGWPKIARRACPDDLVPILEAYRGADVVVSTGGTYLVDHYRIDARLFDYRLARAAGRPLVFFTQSLGPFADPARRRALAPVFADARLVLLRDERSRGYVRSLGVSDEHLRVAADGVFALAEEADLRRGAARAWPATPRVGISVRSWRHFARRDPEAGMAAYRRAMAALVEALVREHDASVTFLSTCQGIPAYTTDDADTAREIRALLSPETKARAAVDGDFHDPLDLSAMYGDLDLVIATRMHAAILALIRGTPVLPIAYEFKTKELFRRLGAEAHVLDIETLSEEGARAALARFLEALPAYRAKVFERVRAERESALSVVEPLRALAREARPARARR
jgi:colanic acid/amylovoran biosynthesis protein